MIQDWNDPEFCLLKVRENPLNLEFVKNQTPEICLEAIKQNGLALEYVKDQTPLIIHYLKKYNKSMYEIFKKENRITISDKEMVEFYNDNPHLLLTL